MELLGIGPLELAFIILIAVIVIGPRDIGKFARGAGRRLREAPHPVRHGLRNRVSRNPAWKPGSRRRTTRPPRRNRPKCLKSLPLRIPRSDVQAVAQDHSAYPPGADTVDHVAVPEAATVPLLRARRYFDR